MGHHISNLVTSTAVVELARSAVQDISRGVIPEDVMDQIRKSIEERPICPDDQLAGPARVRSLGGYQVVFTVTDDAVPA